MTDWAYIVSRALEDQIAIAENNDQNTLFVTLDVLKEILTLLKALLKEQEPVELVESGIQGVLLCGACKCSVMREEGYRFRHCPWCGKKVKWDD